MSIVVTSNFKTEAKPAEKAPAEKSETKVEAVSEKKTDETPAPEGDKPKSETLEASETSNEEKTESGEPEKPKKKNSFQKRIAKLNAKVSAVEQEKEHWRQMAEKLSSSKPTETTQAPKKAEGEPKPEDFEKHEDYAKALARFEVKQELASAKQAEREQALKSEVEERVTKFKDNQEKFKADHEDFDKVVSSVDDIQMSGQMQDAIIDSDDSAKLMYELSKNPEEFERIALIEDPKKMLRELGKFEARFSKVESKPEPKTKSDAPKPLTPVKATGTAKKSIYDSSLSQREYEQLRRDQIKSRNSSW
jgi:hypothetical protein